MHEPVTITLPEGDREVEAIRYAVGLFQALSVEERARVVRYLSNRFDLHLEPHEHTNEHMERTP